MALLTNYTFQSTWRVNASAVDAYRVLHGIGRYPEWWPEVKEVRRLDERRADVRIRAALPYSLRMQLEEEVADEAAGVLRTAITGDLEGWSSWTISETRGISTLRFDEQVTTTSSLMNAFSPVTRPLFRLNHTIMMRHGEQGLRKYLGQQVGRRQNQHPPSHPSINPQLGQDGFHQAIHAPLPRRTKDKE